MEYAVASVLDVHARVTWPLPAVAVSPLGVAGDEGVGEVYDPLSPPPHAVNPSVDSARMGAANASFD
jgi:hypothetical protein